MENRILKSIIRFGAIGLAFGSVAFLMIQVISPGWIPVTRMSVLTLFVMSIIDGEASGLFKTDRLPWWLAYLLHFCIVFSLASLWVVVNGWTILVEQFPLFVTIFVVIYVLIWLIVVVHGLYLAKKLNDSISKRRRSDVD
jgi:hypothetical protein